MKKELPIITIEDCYSYADVVIKLGLSRKGTNTVVAKNYIINKRWIKILKKRKKLC